MEFAAAALFLILVGCQAEPQTLADCDGLSTPTAREECRFAMVAPLAEDRKALDEALSQITDPHSRDLIRYRLAFQDPQKHSGLCREVEEAALHEKCQQIIGRPHLSSKHKQP